MPNKLRKKIESVMCDSTDTGIDLTRTLLSGASRLYGRVIQFRETLYLNNLKKTYALPCHVISVGNLTVGGTGKTPMVIYIAELLTRAGYGVAVVSRGYGGELSSSGGIVSDGQKVLLDAGKAGDEPCMMAKRLLESNIPVIIGSNRYEAGMTAVKQFNPDIVILDDGFQHLRLERDLNILLFDASQPLGNGRVIPRGTMREPVSAVKRADIVVLTRTDIEHKEEAAENFYKTVLNAGLTENLNDIPLFTSIHRPHIYGIIPRGSKELLRPDEKTDSENVYAFSGIAKNHEFRKTVSGMGFQIKGYKEYPDHYAFSASDCAGIEREASEKCVQAVITTEKDYIKLAGMFDWNITLIIISIEIDFRSDEAEFNSSIKESVLNKIKR